MGLSTIRDGLPTRGISPARIGGLHLRESGGIRLIHVDIDRDDAHSPHAV